MDIRKRAALYHHLRHNHYPPAKGITVAAIGKMLDAIEAGDLSPDDPVKVTIDGRPVTLQKGDRAATCAETIADFRLGGFIREHMMQ